LRRRHPRLAIHPNARDRNVAAVSLGDLLALPPVPIRAIRVSGAQIFVQTIMNIPVAAICFVVGFVLIAFLLSKA